MDAYYHGEHHEAYVSYVPVLVTEKRIPSTLVLVYGLGELPMMLLTNRPVANRDDAIHVARAYFSHWRIEEYFRCKKQKFNFEDFRVRKLSAMNSLNFCLTLCMAFLTFINDKPERSQLKYAIFRAAESLRIKVAFNHSRISTGIEKILRHAQAGVRGWHKPRRRSRRNLQLMLSFDYYSCSIPHAPPPYLMGQLVCSIITIPLKKRCYEKIPLLYSLLFELFTAICRNSKLSYISQKHIPDTRLSPITITPVVHL